MQSLSDEWIENRVVRLLNKRGLPRGQTFVFRESASSLPGSVIAMAESGEVSKAIVCFLGSADRWTLLGTDAISSFYNGSRVYIRLDDIQDVRLVGGTTIPRVPCEWIELLDRRGRTFVVWGPPGEECLALCGVLQVLVQMQKSEKAT